MHYVLCNEGYSKCREEMELKKTCCGVEGDDKEECFGALLDQTLRVYIGLRSFRLGTLFVTPRNILLPQLVFGGESEGRIPGLCHHGRMAKKHSQGFHFASEIFVLYFWCENSDLKIPFSPVLCFLSNSVPHETQMNMTQQAAKLNTSAKCLIMKWTCGGKASYGCFMEISFWWSCKNNHFFLAP